MKQQDYHQFHQIFIFLFAVCKTVSNRIQASNFLFILVYIGKFYPMIAKGKLFDVEIIDMHLNWTFELIWNVLVIVSKHFTVSDIF